MVKLDTVNGQQLLLDQAGKIYDSAFKATLDAAWGLANSAFKETQAKKKDPNYRSDVETIETMQKLLRGLVDAVKSLEQADAGVRFIEKIVKDSDHAAPT